jgi:hypothetical protein
VEIGDVLRHQLGHVDDNRRTLWKYLQDMDLLVLLYPDSDPDDFKATGYTTRTVTL